LLLSATKRVVDKAAVKRKFLTIFTIENPNKKLLNLN
jgi:hypothetical protein